MSAAQTGPRRLSSRLQEKVEAHTGSNGANTVGTTKKRKNAYEEEDDGFAFSRVKKNKKPRKSKDDVPSVPALPATQRPTAARKSASAKAPSEEIATVPAQAHENGGNLVAPPKTKRKKMSFSTPRKDLQPAQPVRRSKRLSSEVVQGEKFTEPAPDPVETKPKKKKKIQAASQNVGADSDSHPGQTMTTESVQVQTIREPSESRHSATSIPLPCADTPVIRKNRAMREGKSVKNNDRRSSLGLRGRRASSLIETGSSNALPHQEVEVTNFFKHIESNLVEPRRMRQLLTWCATRAMHPKPKGTDFEDASAKSAARVIEEELLKEFTNKSELSDWFGRDDTLEPPEPLPEKPNPKNVQNLQKIAELEQRINRLKFERDALESLLKPPEISQAAAFDNQDDDVDQSLLSAEDAVLLESLRSSSNLADDVSRRVNTIASTLGPSIDRFADNIHKIAQYRNGTEQVAGKVLAICAQKLDDRERAGRRQALGTEQDRSPGRDLGNVLRGISKADR